MKYLLHLYPRAWRNRYGDELEALLEDQPLGPLEIVDLVRGGLDARLHYHNHCSVLREEDLMLPMNRDELREELRAILAARDELGEDHEHALLETFLDRLEAKDAPRQRDRGVSLVGMWRWSMVLALLWLVAGVTSITLGVPWGMGSTAPAGVLAAAVASGYLGIMLVLILTFFVLSVFRLGRMSKRIIWHPVR